MLRPTWTTIQSVQNVTKRHLAVILSDIGTKSFLIGWQEKQDELNGFKDLSLSSAYTQSLSDDDKSITNDIQHNDNLQIAISPSYLYIEMELCQSDMRIWMDNNDQRPKDMVTNFFTQILQGVKYMHERNIIHRDIKPSNIFFAKGNEKVLKIGDFGLATVDLHFPMMEVAEAGDVLSQGVGTELYQSPEQRKREVYDCKVDIYALGLVYMEMQRQMITERERIEVFTKARRFKIDEDFPCRDLILEMLDDRPDDRPNAKDILERVQTGA